MQLGDLLFIGPLCIIYCNNVQACVQEYVQQDFLLAYNKQIRELNSADIDISVHFRRILFKIALMTFQTLNGSTPA